MSVEETRTNILDAAEMLFAEVGYHATSLRQITDKASANVASVNYHFGGKEMLLDAVLKRRLEPLNAVRLERLQAVRQAAEASGEPMAVRDIYRSFLEPTMDAMDKPEAGYLSLIMGRVFTEFRGVMMERVGPVLGPLLIAYIAAFHEAVPELSKEEVTLRFRMSMGAMHHAIHTMRANVSSSIPEELRCSIESDKIIETLIDYVSRGMEV